MMLECSFCNTRYSISSHLTTPVMAEGAHKGWRVTCDCCKKKWFLDKTFFEKRKPLVLQNSFSYLKDLSSKQKINKFFQYLIILGAVFSLVFVVINYTDAPNKANALRIQQVKSQIKNTKNGKEVFVFGEIVNSSQSVIKMRPIKINITCPDKNGKSCVASWKHVLTKQKLLPKERVSFQTNQLIENTEVSKVEVTIQ